MNPVEPRSGGTGRSKCAAPPGLSFLPPRIPTAHAVGYVLSSLTGLAKIIRPISRAVGQIPVALLVPGPAKKRTRRIFPRRNDPDFGEVLVLAVVPVVLREHFPQLFREFVRLIGGVGVVFASLVVADAESRAAAIAELERFDRIGRIFRDFFVENSHRTIQVVCHVILRWE